MWEDRRHKLSLGLADAARLARAQVRLATAQPATRMSFIVGYPGHADVLAARRVARGRRSSSTLSCRSRTRWWATATLSTPGSYREHSRRSTGRVSPIRSRGRRHGRARGLLRRGVRLAAPSDSLSASSERTTDSSRQADRPTDEFSVLFVGKLIPLHGLETILEAAARSGDPFRRRRQRPARRGARKAARERRPRAVGRLREASRRSTSRRVRARHLRHLGQGGARDPEQGVSGAGDRDPSDHCGHAGRARASRGWSRRPARSRGRCRGAGDGGRAARCGRSRCRTGLAARGRATYVERATGQFSASTGVRFWNGSSARVRTPSRGVERARA